MAPPVFSLDLEGRVVDAKFFLHRHAQLMQQIVIHGGVRIDQMRRQGDRCGAQGPDVQIMDGDDPGHLRQEFLHRYAVNPCGNSIESKIE